MNKVRLNASSSNNYPPNRSHQMKKKRSTRMKPLIIRTRHKKTNAIKNQSKIATIKIIATKAINLTKTAVMYIPVHCFYYSKRILICSKSLLSKTISKIATFIKWFFLAILKIITAIAINAIKIIIYILSHCFDYGKKIWILSKSLLSKTASKIIIFIKCFFLEIKNLRIFSFLASQYEKDLNLHANKITSEIKAFNEIKKQSDLSQTITRAIILIANKNKKNDETVKKDLLKAIKRQLIKIDKTLETLKKLTDPNDETEFNAFLIEALNIKMDDSERTQLENDIKILEGQIDVNEKKKFKNGKVNSNIIINLIALRSELQTKINKLGITQRKNAIIIPQDIKTALKIKLIERKILLEDILNDRFKFNRATILPPKPNSAAFKPQKTRAFPFF